LSGSEVAGVLGFPLPVRPQHSQNARPFRCSFLCPCSETRLSEQSSPGVQLPYTAYLGSSATDISAGSTSLGVPIPFNALGGESPRPSARRLPVTQRTTPSSATPVLPEHSASRSHPASYGVAHRFSQPRSDFFLSPPSRHFQTGDIRGIHPTGGCSSYEASAARRRRNTLVTFFPQTALPPS